MIIIIIIIILLHSFQPRLAQSTLINVCVLELKEVESTLVKLCREISTSHFVTECKVIDQSKAMLQKCV